MWCLVAANLRPADVPLPYAAPRHLQHSLERNPRRGHHLGHRGRQLLAVRHVQELVRPVRVALRAEHAADHHLRLREALLQHRHQRDRAALADEAARRAVLRPRGGMQRVLEPRREAGRVPAGRTRRVAFMAGAAIGAERDLGVVGRVVLEQRLQRVRGSVGVDERRRALLLRVVVAVNSDDRFEPLRVLQVMEPVPRSLAQDMEKVQAGYRDYQEISFSRQALKRLYALTLNIKLQSQVDQLEEQRKLLEPWFGPDLPIDALPVILELARSGDGGAVFTVTLPLAAPGVFTTAILTFIHSWNEFIIALSMMCRRTSSRWRFRDRAEHADLRTLPAGPSARP